MIAIDTETTGLDFWHGAAPYLVTTCDEHGDQRYWEWDVDPVTRRVQVPQEDLDEIRQYLFVDNDGPYIFQNGKFDLKALSVIGLWEGVDLDTIWKNTHDTLVGAHLLASNLPKSLDVLALRYLGIDINVHENALEEACQAARRYCRTNLKDWMIAKADLECMPSASEKCWKYDTWLPRVLAERLNYPEDHQWRHVAATYANMDTAVTVAIWKQMEPEIKARGLWPHFNERMKSVYVAHKMETKGVTVNVEHLDELTELYKTDSERACQSCVTIAATFGHELQLPKGGRNANLDAFMFDVLKLPGIQAKKAKTDRPTLNKAAMAYYMETLPPKSRELTFIKNLLGKRSRDTALSYMEGYRRFWVPLPPEEGQGGVFQRVGQDFMCLHPTLNPTSTDTLRWSSENPNEQNISKQGMKCLMCFGAEGGCAACNFKGVDKKSLRYCFGPAPGREWWSLDAKNIELRIPFYESGEEEMIALFEQPDDPPFYGSNHILIFSILWPELWDKAVKEVGLEKAGPYCKKKYADREYQWTKNGNFATQYGAVEKADGWGTADRAYHQQGGQKKVNSRFSKLSALNDKWIKYAEKYGYVETMPDKTVDPTRGYPLLVTRTEWGRILPTVPLNYHVQGTAMWWTMKAMNRVDDFFSYLNDGGTFAGKKWPGGYYLVMQVHDEVVPDMPSGEGRGQKPWDYNMPIATEVQRLMALGGDDIGVPTPVGLEYHSDNWAEGVSL